MSTDTLNQQMRQAVELTILKEIKDTPSTLRNWSKSAFTVRSTHTVVRQQTNTGRTGT